MDISVNIKTTYQGVVCIAPFGMLRHHTQNFGINALIEKIEREFFKTR